jgi:hypothetical protein
MHPEVRLAVLGTVIMLLAGSALAFSPVEQNAQWEIPRLGSPSQLTWETYRAEEVRSLGVTPVEAFAGQYSGEWCYQVNRTTGTYHHVFGSGVDLGTSPTSEQAAEDLARDFIRDNPNLFAIGNEDLSVMSNARGLGKRSVIFQQTYKGLRVYGGRTHLIFTEAGRLFEMGSDVYPGIDISTDPSLSESQALEIAKSGIGFDEGTDQVTHTEILILPVELAEGGLEYRLAYRLDLRVEVPLGVWATYVDANTGEILWRENQIRFADYSGHVQGDVEWMGYCDGYTYDYPLKNMYIDVSGVGTTTTDQNGDFLISGSSGSRDISAEFRGPWVDVDHYSGGDPSHSGTITDGTPYTIDWNSSNSDDDDRDVFAYVNRIHDCMKGMDPTFTDIDYEMTAVIQRTDGYCPGNAWWDIGLETINFCSAGSGYGNTGRMGDVVFHEYGHGITQFMYDGNDPPSDMHEGNSDIIANYLTRESIMGLGFYLNDCVSGIRDSDNNIQYPCSGTGHYCGQVIAGFHWDSWQELLAGYAQAYADSVAMYTWHYGRILGLPQSQPDQVHYTFVADDDDGNLGNGTPHYDEFCVGAANHSFDCPEITVGVDITHTPLGNTSNTTTPYEVTATITSTGGNVVEDSCNIYYRANGGSFGIAGMTATGSPDEYHGYIPAQAGCTQADYFLHAADDAGSSTNDPDDAPVSVHTFLVAYDPIYEDDFETDQGWTAGLPGDGATTGQWERCDPEATEAQAEDDHTEAPGVNAYITECAAGASQGTYDVDGGKTTLQSPVIDLGSYDRAAVSYHRWYSNDTGAEPMQDYWIVKVSDDGWTTSATLESTNVSARAWTQMEFDIAAYVDLTSTVQFRFIASDYDPGSLVEAGVDDFLISGCAAGGDTIPPTVTVNDPNGGEVIVGGGGSTYDIEWTSSDNVGIVTTHIVFSTDSGTSYPDTIATGVLASPHTWDVPDMDSGTCRIKIVCLDAESNEGSDESDADFEIRSISGIPGLPDTPEAVVLFQNRPSPFDASTEIRFGLPSSQRVSLKVYNVDGRQVASLVDGIYPAGYHRAVWHGADDHGEPVAPGMYFYRMVTEKEVLTRKMMIVK